MIYKRAINKAKQSICRYKISALGFDKKGNYIGSAFNQPRFSRYKGSIHAEMNLMSKYGKRLKTILICRVNRNGNIAPIKPCNMCKKKAKELGIKIETFYG